MLIVFHLILQRVPTRHMGVAGHSAIALKIVFILHRHTVCKYNAKALQT